MDLKGLNFTKYSLFMELKNAKNISLSPFNKEGNATFNLLEANPSLQTSSIKIENKEWSTLLERVKEILFSLNKALEIEFDNELKIPIYKIIDLKTKEVLKQIPLEDILKFKKALAKFLQEELAGKIEVSGLILKKEV